MTTSINNAFNLDQVVQAFSLGTTQRNGMIKDLLGHLIANTDSRTIGTRAS